MKEMKRFLSLFLCLVMLVGYLPVNAFADDVAETQQVTEATQAVVETVVEDSVDETGSTDETVTNPEDETEGEATPDEGVVIPDESTDAAEDETAVPGDDVVDEEEEIPEETEAKKPVRPVRPVIVQQVTDEAASGDTVLLAEGESVVVVAGSDYQQNGTAPKTNTQNILNQIVKEYSSAVGFLFGGDYSQTLNSSSSTTSGINELKGVVQGVYGTGMSEVYVQGNHDAAVSGLTATGKHDTDYYGVFSINEDDFSSSYTSSGSYSSTMLTELESYLDAKVAAGYKKPVFVATHLPLHATSRNDNNAANKIFTLLNDAGDKGLNIIFLFGHNHSQGYDAYLGNGSIYLPKGSSITVAGGSTSTLNFTYMNNGYVGYVTGSACTHLSMTTFEIYEDEVIIKRYSTDGQHLLKEKGATVSGYNTDANEYGYAVLDLSDGTSTTYDLSTEDSGSGDTGSGDSNTGSGSTGGSTGGSGYTYELVTSIEPGESYVIVGNDDAVALMDNNGSFGSQNVTISGTTLTSDVALTEWTISGTDNGTIISDAGHQLGYDNSAWGLVTGGTLEFDITASSGKFMLQMQRGYNNYNFYYDGTDWTDKDTADHYVRLYKLTSGSGSGGGSTVTPEGGDWVTISSGIGGTIYTLDEDGLNVGSDEKYLIVDTSANGTGNAMTNSNGTAANTTVTIADKVIVVEDDTNVAWTPTGSSSSANFANGSYNIYLSYNNGVLHTSTRSLKVTHNGNGEYTLKRDSNSSGYYVQYDSSDGWDTLSTAEKSVYLYRKTGTESAGDAEYAKLVGELTYTLERGLDKDAALAVVMNGIDVVVSGDKTTETVLDDSNENITWTLANTYDGAIAGEYAVVIKYKDVTLGTAKVIVPEVAITGYDCQTSGSVKVGATGKTRTGANITVNLEDGTSYTVPVTLDMLSGDFNTADAGSYSGLTVTYNGVVVCEDFTLNVREPSSYPEYPDEGAVKVNKTGTGIQFQSTGVAQIEVSASGIPMNQGVDVLLVLDTSSSMGMEGSLTDGRTRIDVLKECVNALIANLQQERADGSVPDVEMAVVHFNGYTGNKNTNYIGSTARSTSTLGGTLTDDGNGGAWVDVQNMGSNWAANIPDNCSGTNYDHGLLQAYDLLSARQTAESSRKQFVLFMSDGAPFQYNGVNSNSLSSDWENWILGSYTQAEVEALSHVNNPEFYYGNNNGNGQKHRVAEAIKGTGTFKIVTYSDTSSSGTTKLEEVSGLGVTMYSVGLALEASNMPTDVAGQEAILTTIASSPDLFYSVTSAAGLQAAFDDFAGEVLMAATNARFVDKMGAQYDLQMGQILDLNDEPIGVENKIEILSYTIWTRSDYLAGNCTLEQIGDRKLDADGKPIATVLETITFNADGTEVYSDKINNGQTNILGDGTQEGFAKDVIYAKNFMYNNGATAIAVDGVDIPTGVDEKGLTTGSTNMLPAETFYWKVGTIKTTELAMRYYVYLEGSMEGTCEPGSYPTNEYANLYYNNYLNQPTGQPCQKPTFSPVMAWAAANVSYAFYLVDENGNIVVNQTTGETGSFANKIAVTNPVVYKEILLNNTGNVESIEVASLGVLPDGYELYDEDAVYTVQIKSDATGSWTIAKGNGSKASTYVTHYDLDNSAAYTNELTKNSDADFTHTIVWFAVVWKVQALPDSVVVDYGLPVDISVLTNDMFGENGKLVGVGAYSDDLNMDGHEAALASGFGTTYTGTYGTAKADTTTGKVRYTLNTMQMDGYDKFAYAANYTGATNPGYYYDTVTVIPATTIYYEDNFLIFNKYNTSHENIGTWSFEGELDANATQNEDRPGKYSLTDANNIYGYDSVNNGMSTFSLGQARKVHVDASSYATASFTFTGTGFDVISMTSNTTGTITVQVTDAGGNAVKNAAVNTYYGYTYTDGKWVATPDVPNSLYQVPVMQIEGLTYGTYNVVIKATYATALDKTTADGYELYLDAIRIYDPADDGATDDDTVIEDAYKADGEGWPSYFELRNKLIDPNNDGILTDGTLGNDDTDTEIIGEVFIDGDGEVKDAQLEDYKSYGPNNEVYLAKDQSVAFLLGNVTTNVQGIHLGAKSANGAAVTYNIKNIARNSNEEAGVNAGDVYNVKTNQLDTATDMYYDITGWKNDIIVITNISDSILSLTNIKATYKSDPNGTAVTSENGDGNIPPVTSQSTSNNEVYAYMTPAAAKVTLRSMNNVVDEPEETLPDESVPETTEPDASEPESSVPETTTPEESTPETTVPEETVDKQEQLQQAVKETVTKVVKTVKNVLKNLFSKWFR